ncbi:hypothetical protein KIN20_012003, partial [Parelaphostrongylus tenuis]
METVHGLRTGPLRHYHARSRLSPWTTVRLLKMETNGRCARVGISITLEDGPS